MKRLLSRWLCVGFSLWLLSAHGGVTNIVNVGSGGSVFSPNRITNQVGDSIRFVLAGGTHTVSSNGVPAEPFCGNSSLPGSCVVTFNAAGLFPFRCNFHSGSTATPSTAGMTGAVVVVAAPGVPPSVSITNPAINSLLAAPATVVVGVSATDSDGTVANVRLLTNGVFAATNSVAPFGFTLNNLPPGFYLLRARAEDNQALSSTSAPILVRVASRPAISFLPGTNGPLQFQFTSATGINYVVEQASALTNFTPLSTNPGSGGSLQFSETNSSSTQLFIRVRLQ